MDRNVYWENGERVNAVEPVYEDQRRHQIDDPALVMMRRLLGFLKSSPHPPLTIDCLCLISGLCYDGKSMVEIARKHMVSRAAVSRRCVDLCEAFGIEPVRAMRSKKGRANCRNARIESVKQSIK